MPVDPARVALYVPDRLKGPKRQLLDEIGARCGALVRRPDALGRAVADGLVPCVGCYMELRPQIRHWMRAGRPWIYRDRGYFRRGALAFAGTPKGSGEGYWRWHAGSFQLRDLAPGDDAGAAVRLDRLRLEIAPWRPAPPPDAPVLLAAPSEAYAEFHGQARWADRAAVALRRHTGRPVVVRRKERGAPPLRAALAGAHALVTHGSIAAVEAAVLGCPVFVDRSSAAAPVGLCDLSAIELPATPPREAWLRALAASQFNAAEMRAGLHWRALELGDGA